MRGKEAKVHGKLDRLRERVINKRTRTVKHEDHVALIKMKHRLL